MKNTWFDLTEFIIFIVRIILICESCYSRFFDIGHSMLFLFEMFSSNVVTDKYFFVFNMFGTKKK